MLEALLGRGGMGEVYRARDTVKGRVVAVKLLPERLARDTEYESRFEREARIAASVTDPHVVPIHDYGRIDGVLFLEMPLIDGTDLKTVIDQQAPLPLERAVDIVEQVAGALDAAHAAGLTHRDVKPANVLVTVNGFCYLADFGIAAHADDTAVTGQGSVVGSTPYLAPERLRGATATPAGDTYALACIAYELLSGRRAFGGSDIASITHQQLTAYPPPPPANVPDDASLALRRALDKDPANRPATSGDFARELRAAVPAPVAHKGWSRMQWIAVAAAVALVVSIGSAVGVKLFGGNDGSDAVVLMPADQTSPDGFTTSVASGNPSETLKQPHVRRKGSSSGTDGATPTAPVSLSDTTSEVGDASGMYGSPGGEGAVCDTASLVSMITRDKTRARVWSGLLGTTPDKIRPTIAAMTSLILRSDTLVMNSDYKNGKAIQYPAVLQAGTAVLVDRYGVPKVKCNCGNPLAQAPTERPSKISGKSWREWNGSATEVTKAKSKITSFSTTDVSTGKPARVKPGSDVATVKDRIERYDFSNSTWSVGDETITLKNGKYDQPASENDGHRFVWELGDTFWKDQPDNDVTGRVKATDVNGDGHLDMVKEIVAGEPRTDNVSHAVHLWVWDPKKNRPVQDPTNLYDLGGRDPMMTSLKRIVLRKGGVDVSFSEAEGDSWTDTYVWRDGKLRRAEDTAAKTKVSKAWPSEKNGWTIEKADDRCASGASGGGSAAYETPFATKPAHFSCGATADALLVCDADGDTVTCIRDYAGRNAVRFTSPGIGSPRESVRKEPDPLQVKLTNGKTCDPVSHDHAQHPDGRQSWMYCGEDGSAILFKGDRESGDSSYFDKSSSQWTVEYAVGTDSPRKVGVLQVVYAR